MPTTVTEKRSKLSQHKVHKARSREGPPSPPWGLEPTMSDTTVIMTMDDMIGLAFGSQDKNLVDFKMMQTVLYILARHLRILEQIVEVRVHRSQPAREGAVSSEGIGKPKHKKHKGTSHAKHISSSSVEGSEHAEVEESDDGARTTKSGVKHLKGETQGKDEGSDEGSHRGEKGTKKSHDKDEKIAKGKEKEHKGKHSKEKEADVMKKDSDIEEKDTAHKGKPFKEKDADSRRKESLAYKGKRRSTHKFYDSSKEKEGKEGDKSGKKMKPGSQSKVGSIEVVTRQQFQLLQRAVQQLQVRAAAPAPRVPANKQLMADIAAGTASVNDVIAGMQLQSRIQAAEKAIERMAELISLLASSAALPAEVLETFTELEGDLANMAKRVEAFGGMHIWDQNRKALGLETLGAVSGMSTVDVEASEAMKRGLLGRGYGPSDFTMMKEKDAVSTTSAGATLATEITGYHSLSKKIVGTDFVTRKVMENKLRALREDFVKNVANITGRAHAAAQHAVNIAQNVADKLATALKLNDRVSVLYSMVNDYTEELHGFDLSVETQMQSFKQQLNQIDEHLHEGLHELHTMTNTAETTAVLELTEQYKMVATELDNTIGAYQGLASNHDLLTEDIESLAKWIEQLRDQKADRLELIDGLRDKAEMRQLAGLITQEEFAGIHEDLEIRMQMCYDKFRAQDTVWMNVVQDFKAIILQKAEVMHLQSMQDQVQTRLHELNRQAIVLARVLGDPKAAVLTRRLTKDSSCAACAHSATMEVSELSRMEPPRLAAVRARPVGGEAVALKEKPEVPKLVPYEDETKRIHICKRWCGGSHTLLPQVAREKAPPFPYGNLEATRRYLGEGHDHKLYMLSGPCQPCDQCNVVETHGEEEMSPHSGAGDQGDGPAPLAGAEGLGEVRLTIASVHVEHQLMRAELSRKRRRSDRRRGPEWRPSDTGSPPDTAWPGCFQDTVATQHSDIGNVMKDITVGDDEPVRRVSFQLEGAQQSDAQDVIQLAAVVPHAVDSDSDIISEAISKLSSLKL